MGGFVGEESIICRLQSDLVVVHSNSPTRGVFGSDNQDKVDKVFEPFESADSFGIPSKTCWDATRLWGVLTHPWDGQIHSSFLLNPQMPTDFGQVLLGCHPRDSILTHPRDGGIYSEEKHNSFENACQRSSSFKIVSRRVRFSLN